jgi:hypothetical protein
MRLSGMAKAYWIMALSETFMVRKFPSLDELQMWLRWCGKGVCGRIEATSNAGGVEGCAVCEEVVCALAPITVAVRNTSVSEGLGRPMILFIVSSLGDRRSRGPLCSKLFVADGDDEVSDWRRLRE